MHSTLRYFFWFILKYFEEDGQDYVYKPINRIILLTVGLLFSALAILIVIFSVSSDGLGFLIPVVVFLAVGITCLVVGFLGTDQAVAKIWGNR